VRQLLFAMTQSAEISLVFLLHAVPWSDAVECSEKGTNKQEEQCTRWALIVCLGCRFSGLASGDYAALDF
jgi:hypothetical protein